MSIQFSLGIISSVDIHAVPVSVGDGAAIFHYDGQLVGEFYNIKDDTVIQWSQVSGVPVTFTSPLNEETITFTSNDLDKKVFKCCTNPGTDAELCALAEFYHFPVDWTNKMDVFDNKSSSIHDPNALTLADFDAFNFRLLKYFLHTVPMPT